MQLQPLDIIFIINLIVCGMVAILYHRQKNARSLIISVIILLTMGTLKISEVYYSIVGTNLRLFLGAEIFAKISAVIRYVVFFSGSIYAGIQFVLEAIYISFLVAAVFKVTAYFVKNKGKNRQRNHAVREVTVIYKKEKRVESLILRLCRLRN